jgi:hypothetical protein
MQQDTQKKSVLFTTLSVLKMTANLPPAADWITVISTPNFRLPLTASVQTTAQFACWAPCQNNCLWKVVVHLLIASHQHLVHE